MDLTTVLRLEVEAAATGLVNLVQNPNGELGGWGWITPLASSAIAGDPLNLKLTYTRSVAGASYFTSELMPIAAGQYAAASYVQKSAGNAYHRARFEWYDATKTLLSSSAQTALTAPSGAATSFVSPVVAPATTAYVKLRIDLYTNAGANPAGAHTFAFTNATLAVAATSGALATIRTNLIKNPSMETNVTGWTGAGGVLTRSTTTAQVGAASLRVQATGGDATIWTAYGTAGIPVSPGQAYTASCYAKAGTVARGFDISIIWWDAAGDFIDQDHGTSAALNLLTFTRMSVVGATAPVGAAYASVQVESGSPLNGELYYFDAFLFEKSATLGAYFDGATAAAGTKTYAWTGTAQLSTSTETDTQLFYFPPRTYVNILGPATYLKVTRPTLDVGALNATVKDTSLDPATATLLRPGRRCRLLALNHDTGIYDVLFSGEMFRAGVTYDLKREDSKQATISITAYDATRDAASSTRSQGVGTIAELPYVLEGAGIPWNFNGSGNQVAAATVVSINESATALDQVVLTRDSALGYAWVTKEGIITAYDDRTADYYGNGDSIVDESVYSDIDLSFDTSDCINELTVAMLTLDSATGTTDEKILGPYRDAASVAEWGSCTPDEPFRVHGIAEAAVPAYAQEILDANKTPALRVNGVTIPIRTPEDITEDKALIDLYAVARVKNTAKGVDVRHRVTFIEHEITPRRWTMTQTYGGLSTVAAPGNTPEPPATGASDGVWKTPTFTNGWSYYGGGATVRYMRKNGVVYLKGILTGGVIGSPAFTLPAGFRPAEVNFFTAQTNVLVSGAASAGTAHTHNIGLTSVRCQVDAGGGVTIAAGTNTQVSISGISFPAEA